MTDMRATELGLSVRFILIRLDSTKADMVMLRTFNTWPTPIRVRGVRGRPINFCQVGYRKMSNRAKETTVDINTKTKMDPVGI